MESNFVTGKLYAPTIDNIITRYRQSRDLADRLISPKLIAIYEMMGCIMPDADNNSQQIWIEVSRGDISDFGDFNEFLDAGEVETYEEFESFWRECYPEETKMNHLPVNQTILGRTLFHFLTDCYYW